MSGKKYAFETRSSNLLGHGWNAAMGAAVEKVHKAALEGLEGAADFVFAESQKQVPVLEGPAQLKRAGASDPGELKRSGEVTMDPENNQAAIAYKTVYASLQHERMDYHHPEGGNAKFLERPLVESRDQVVEIIAAKIREATEK